MKIVCGSMFCWLLALGITVPGLADEAVRLEEKFEPATQYHVSTRVAIEGSMSLPAEKEKQQPKILTVKGDSAIDYDERVLTIAPDGQVERTIRIYNQIDFQRKVGEHDQQGTIRPSVRRLVLLRQNNVKAPFSPDGPLMWHEMDLVRTDVFTPTLAGLLPDRPVKPDDRWTASTAAIQELTDMGKIDEGKIECRLDEIVTPDKDKHRRARISFSGTVRGLNEDGPNRQQLDGFFYFDLDLAHITYITLDGVSSMLDKEGKELGRIKGQFVLTRIMNRPSRTLSDESLRGVPTEPRDDLTQILFEDPNLGLRFLYPRRWRLAQADANRIDLDSADGNGMRLTLETLRNLPTGAQFLGESQRWLQEQKALVTRTDPPRRLQSPPKDLESFTLSAEVKGQQVELDYYVARQAGGGVIISARLLPGKQLADVRKEVEGIARSISVLKDIKEPKKDK